ncbi:MAG: TonB-dependent receptor [Cyclobacteriaceae bacterium]|nr:TonB-dependent receptor [Cyclobacteriaceae bacterium]
MKNLLLAAALLLSATLVAQNSINGLLIDSETNNPLPGATVQLVNTNKASITSASGTFSFNSLTKNNYRLKIKFVGYKTLEVEVSPSTKKQVFTLQVASIITDEVIVSATRASDKTPMTFRSIEKKEIDKQNYGKDFPYLLESTASVVTTSDAGAGVGYTGIRIRGSDATRVNVTLNGIPYNDSESQGVYWVDLPDIASSVESVQVQRGVGTSTNGAGAFGASINIQTSTLNPAPYASIDNSLGSFNTRKHTLMAGTGLLNNKFTIDGRLSKIVSDGYIDRAESDLTSFYLSGGYYGENSMLKFNIFSGKEVTYQSWYGTPESRARNDEQGMQDYISRNGLDAEEADNLLNSGRTYNFYTYDNQVDDYTQTHYQLLYAWDISSAILLNTALHYTKGYGYYEQYKKREDLDDYGFGRTIMGNDTIFATDLIRRRWLDNDFYGATFSLTYNPSTALNAIIGGAWNQYSGDHFGEIIWAQYAGSTSIRDRYYDNNGLKTDFTIYGKVIWDPISNLSLFADIQYRKVGYTLKGIDNDGQLIDQDHDFDFINPKVGASYQLTDNSSLYASFSIGNKEPNRTDFVDASMGETPLPESLQNLEVGYKKRTDKLWFQSNFYLMDYKNQLVLTGELNDVGSSLRTNVDKSYRMGIELETGIKLNPILDLQANATFSRNIIQSFDETVYDYGTNWDEFNVVTVNHNNSQIAFSPNVTAGATLVFHPFKDFEVAWVHKYVGKQYLDNTTDENRKIDSYYISDARASYGFSALGIKRISFNLAVYNLFNKMYEANGYTWGNRGGGNDVRENFYYPQAGTHFMLGLRLEL